MAPRQAIVLTMPLRHVIILILSFQGIIFENFSKTQRQYLSNGKEIDSSKVTSPHDWMDISGRHFEDLHRNIDRSHSQQADLNYQVKLA